MAWRWWDDFDKRFCGKWRSYGIFLNIEFDEKNVNVNFSFNVAYFNQSAFYVEWSYNSLYFFHNDREWRMEYILTYNDDKLKCKRIQRKNNTEEDFEFTRLSEEEEAKCKYTVAPKDAAKIDILKEYAEYGDVNADVKFEFKFDEHENMLDILEKYNLDELVKDKSDVETAIALMHWFCARYRHGNPQDGGLAKVRTPQALMEYADQHEGRTNCRGLAITLVQLIRAYNIKAFHTTCMPYEQPFDDCHVVVNVYCENLGKWIMLDPSANLYLKNNAGEIIGVEEFRDILLADGELFANPESTNWGNEGNMENLDGYRDYMAKNLMRIERYGISSYGKDWQGGNVILIPQKYFDNEAKNFDETQQKNFITSREYFWQSDYTH